MRRARTIPTVSPSALLVCALILVHAVAAHGGDDGGHAAHVASDMGMDMGMGASMSTGDEAKAPEIEYPPTYFAHGEHAGLMLGHIGFMSVSWIFILPVGETSPPPRDQPSPFLSMRLVLTCFSQRSCYRWSTRE
jgi:hypothetical protein